MTPATKQHENAHMVTTPAEQQGLQVASMIQESGFAAVLVVEDVLIALERDPSTVSHVVRACVRVEQTRQRGAIRGDERGP